MKTKLFISFFLILCPILGLKSQVTIGLDKNAVKGALLQLKQEETTDGAVNATKGLGLPRVGLEKRKQLFPMFEADGAGYKNAVKTEEDEKHIGLVVFNMTDNTDTEKAEDELLCQGPYVWDGNIWVRLLSPCKLQCKPENSDNCIIVNPRSPDPLLIPVGKPYMVWKETAALGNLELDGKVSAELLWQDTQSLITSVDLAEGDLGACSKIRVIANGSKQGNALVAVHIGPNGNNTDPIRWSWHVWVTTYNPDTEVNGTIYTHNNGEKKYIFMDRNLGAIATTATDVSSMGLMYQWGRKDPFTSNPDFYNGGNFGKPLYNISNTVLTEVDELFENSTGTGIQHLPVTQTNNLAASIMNPKIFYYGPVSATKAPFDWYTTDDTGASGNNNLWETDASKKSPFDPCPKGWRVPTNSVGGLMPWDKYKSLPGGWIGISSPADFKDTGANMQLSGGADFIGFYPYGASRNDRELVHGCGNTGSSPYSHSGGIFYNCMNDSDLRESYYWIANPGIGATASIMRMYYNPSSGPMAIHNLTLEAKSRSLGAAVRCVQIDTTP